MYSGKKRIENIQRVSFRGEGYRRDRRRGTTLASIELLEYNKTDLERMLGNEKRAKEKQEQQHNNNRKKSDYNLD